MKHIVHVCVFRKEGGMGGDGGQRLNFSGTVSKMAPRFARVVARRLGGGAYELLSVMRSKGARQEDSIRIVAITPRS